MTSTYNIGSRAFTCYEDLEKWRRVKIKSGTTEVPPGVHYADAGEAYIGLTMSKEDEGDVVAVETRTYLAMAADTFSIGATLYGAADGKVSDTSIGTAQFIALEAATAAGDVVEVVELQTASTTAATVSFADAALATDEETVEAALAEIYQHIVSTQAVINCPMGAFTEQDGTALVDFANADSATPGWSAGDQGFGIRWNNNSTSDPIATGVVIPPDLDASADVILHVLAAKVGATVGDAVTWLVEAFNNADGVAYDADADFGGTSSAMTGDATTKTCQEETLTLAAANIAASPCVMNLTIQPTDATVGTDDVIIFGIWLEYTRKALTA